MAAAEPAARPAREPILVLEKLDKRFGATHALKVRRSDLRGRRDSRHRRREWRRQVDADQAADRRPSALIGRDLLARQAGPARQSARIHRPRHQRGASGGRALPSPDRRRQHLSRRRGNARRASRQEADGARRPEPARRPRILLARRRPPVFADHRPAAARRDGARGAARREIPHLRRADRLSHAPGSGGAVQADPPAQGQAA